MMNMGITNKGLQRPADSNPVGGLRWLTTFNDLITLLMVFFVLLFAMGSMDVKRFKHFQNALQSALGVLNAGSHAPVGIIVKESPRLQEGVDAPAKRPAAENKNDSSIDTRGLEAVYTPEGIHLTLDDKLLFSSGSARLTPGGEALLDRVGRIIKPLKRSIRVEGHTDNRPIATTAFPSNWELSTARAVRVVKYLIQAAGIAPQYLAAAGYGDSKPRVPNDSEPNMSRNRRVEIILGPVASNSTTANRK
jgi:chemotaxis protein MotB